VRHATCSSLRPQLYYLRFYHYEDSDRVSQVFAFTQLHAVEPCQMLLLLMNLKEVNNLVEYTLAVQKRTQGVRRDNLAAW
jgi:hypothetical protein